MKWKQKGGACGNLFQQTLPLPAACKVAVMAGPWLWLSVEPARTAWLYPRAGIVLSLKEPGSLLATWNHQNVPGFPNPGLHLYLNERNKSFL